MLPGALSLCLSACSPPPPSQAAVATAPAPRVSDTPGAALGSGTGPPSTGSAPTVPPTSALTGSAVPHSTARPSTRQTATPAPPTGPHGDPYCVPADFQLTATPDHANGTYTPGQTVAFTLTATYEGSTPCDFGGAEQPDEQVNNSMEQPVYIWTCADYMCGHFLAKDPLQKGQVAFTTTAAWREDQCTQSSCSGCEPNCQSNPPAPPGTYSAFFTSQQVGRSNTVSITITA